MRFELELLRPFRLVDRERDSEVPLRSNAKIVAYLALSRSPRSRESILQVTWPEVEAKVSRNRLRVALNQLRALLPGVLVESSAGLTLDRAVLHCDAWDLEQAIDDCANTVTEADELAQLSRTLPAMDEASPMCRWPDVSVEFGATVAAAHVRAVSVAQCLEKYEDAARLAEQGLTWDTAHPELWSGFVNASWSLGTGAAALERLRATKNMELQQLPTLRELADQVRTAPAPEVKSLSATEGHMMTELFDSLARARPELCRQVLSAPESLPLAGKYPRQMHDLLERVTADPAEPDEAWERCFARMIGLKAWLNDAAGVLMASERLLPISKNSAVLRAVWNAVSVAHSLARDWPKAMDALDRTIAFARETGNQIDLLSALGNRAFFLLQQGKFEEAEVAYREALAPIEHAETPREQFEYAIGFGNSTFIHVLSGNWRVAKEQLVKAIDLRTSRHGIKIGLLQTALAMTKAQLGHFEEVPALIRAGFLDAFSTDSARDQQITFEFAAGALLATGERKFGVAVLDWVDEWRQRTGLPRSQAELDLCARLVSSTGKSQHRIQSDKAPPEVGRELMRRLRRTLR